MCNRWYLFNEFCPICDGNLAVKSIGQFRFSLNDEIKCLECPAVGILVADDSDIDSVGIRWAS